MNKADLTKIHRTLALILLLPMLGWVITGAIFMLKPGYDEAYEQIRIKTYSIDRAFTLPVNESWLQVRYLKTILGYHLLVEKTNGQVHLNPETGYTLPEPGQKEMEELINDAISVNRERYGEVVDYRNHLFVTDTGVEISFDWNSLSISQSGRDTRFIDRLYKIHYLQWFGHDRMNNAFGALGLLTLLILMLYGLLSYITIRKDRLDA